MRRAVSETLLRTQTIWEKYEGWIIVALGFAFLLVCAHIGEARTGR